MYIFLTTSVSLWMGIVWANAYKEQQLVKANIIPIESTIYAKIALQK
jgi:hypothetical protein